MSYIFLQHYWWFIISLLAAILVFLFFVQGGQSLMGCIAKNDTQRKLIVNALGRKWEFTFTTLVTFGGAFFASFPLFYSTSFGGAFYVWMAILLVMVIQAVSYEFRSKAGNLLGQKTYDTFLLINGALAPLLVGTAVGTFFTGANFTIETANISNTAIGTNIISEWTTPWRGLEAVLDFRNVALGLAVLFFARAMGLLYFINNIQDEQIIANSRKALRIEAPLSVVFFLVFFVSILLSEGFAVTANGEIVMEKYKYFNNLLAMPCVLVTLLIGVLLVLFGYFKGLFTKSRSGIWFSGVGLVLAVLALLLTAGFNNTAYYPSVADLQSSLTITNSSSSEFTLKTMFYVSLAIPVVLGYIWYAWRSMNKGGITKEEVENDSHSY